MNQKTLTEYLSKIDAALEVDGLLFIYGSAAFMLLEEEMRTSLDIDVAAPFSRISLPALEKAAKNAGLPVNPDETFQADHIEWVGPLRLCLPSPDDATDLLLWQGAHLTVKTVSGPGLVASKLIRYDETDQSDIHFLYFQLGLTFEQVELAVETLPAQFSEDAIVRDNLENLKADIQMWEANP
ncbi:hypothetical protein BVY04_05230 [bacterium M21]|nr:hypothetical protein BVY04_05230 [bacterium M21]